MLTSSAREAQRILRMREGYDRRVGCDRRQSPVGMRLRVGLWYQYHRATRAGEFDPLPRGCHRQAAFAAALLPEMSKYEFHARGEQAIVAGSCALSGAVEHLWAHAELGCNALGESTAAYAVNAIADYLLAAYEVRGADRRKGDRRMAIGAAAS